MAGALWAALAGVTFGTSQIANRGVNMHLDALRASTAMVTSLLAFSLLGSALTGGLSEIPDMPSTSVAWFVAAGLVHFLFGWTFFALSQQRIGPSRSASILSVNPVMGAFAAWVVLGEALRPVTWVGVVSVTLGVALVASGRMSGATTKRANPTLVLLATACFSVSPLFVRFGLEGFPNPLLGLTVGMAVTVPTMHLSSRLVTGRWVAVPAQARRWLVYGGLSAAVAITAQWTAFGLITVGAAISIQQLSTPVVLFAGPWMLRTPSERVTPRLLWGTVLTIAGAVVVALFGRPAA